MMRDDRDLLDRVERLTRAPELAPARRVAFQQELDRRLAQRGRRGLGPLLACALAVALLGLSTILSAPDAPAPEPRAAVVSADHVEPALAFSDEVTPGLDAALPDDYLAIAALMLGG